MKFSEKLYEIRKNSGLSQEELAEKIGVSRQSVSKWETGQAMPEYEKLLALCEYFKVSVDSLLKGEDMEGKEANAEKVKNYSLAAGAAIFGLSLGSIILIGVFSALFPEAAGSLDASSAITVNGRGIAMILCTVAMFFGISLILKRR